MLESTRVLKIHDSFSPSMIVWCSADLVYCDFLAIAADNYYCIYKL